MKAIIRAFAFGRKDPLFEEPAETGELVDNPEMFAQFVQKHIEQLQKHPDHVIEIEFPPMHGNPAEFVRFGTDPRLMKIPIPLEFLRLPQRTFTEPLKLKRHFTD